MTREEANKCLKWFKEYNEEDYCGGDRIQDEHGDWYYRITEKDFEAFDVAIKALEQEPILDKIRAEISTVYESLDGYDPDSLGTFVSKIDEIFDRYKEETEAE